MVKPQGGASPRPPVTLLVGSESVLRDEEIRSLEREIFKDPSFRSINTHLCGALEHPLSEILTLAQTAPFLAAKRLIIVKDAERFKADDQKLLLAHLRKQPVPAEWVLICEDPRASKSSFMTELARMSRTVNCQAPYRDGDAVAWVRRKASERGKTLTPDAALLLLELTGKDLTQLASRVEQLAVLADARAQITADDVSALVGASGSRSSFLLYGAAEKGDFQTAWRIAGELRDQGARPHEILGGMVWKYDRNVRIKNLLEQGAAPADVSRELGIAPFMAEREVNSASTLKRARASKEMRALWECETSVKRGTLDPELALARCLFRFCENQPL